MILQRLFIISIFWAPLFLFGQTGSFPGDWEGKWTGSLDIYRYSSLVDTIPMGLNIQKLDSGRWTFYISYGSGDKEQERLYELVVVDPLNGHYRIDEKNGIYLDAFYHDNCLYERFSVAGNMLTNSICKNEEQLYYEITFGAIDAITSSGDTILNATDTIPEVKSYGVPSVQKAVLKRN